MLFNIQHIIQKQFIEMIEKRVQFIICIIQKWLILVYIVRARSLLMRDDSTFTVLVVGIGGVLPGLLLSLLLT